LPQIGSEIAAAGRVLRRKLQGFAEEGAGLVQLFVHCEQSPKRTEKFRIPGFQLNCLAKLVFRALQVTGLSKLKTMVGVDPCFI
jgi:hypothetical protein